MNKYIREMNHTSIHQRQVIALTRALHGNHLSLYSIINWVEHSGIRDPLRHALFAPFHVCLLIIYLTLCEFDYL